MFSFVPGWSWQPSILKAAPQSDLETSHDANLAAPYGESPLGAFGVPADALLERDAVRCGTAFHLYRDSVTVHAR